MIQLHIPQRNPREEQSQGCSSLCWAERTGGNTWISCTIPHPHRDTNTTLAPLRAWGEASSSLKLTPKFRIYEFSEPFLDCHQCQGEGWAGSISLSSPPLEFPGICSLWGGIFPPLAAPPVRVSGHCCFEILPFPSPSLICARKKKSRNVGFAQQGYSQSSPCPGILSSMDNFKNVDDEDLNSFEVLDEMKF